MKLITFRGSGLITGGGQKQQKPLCSVNTSLPGAHLLGVLRDHAALLQEQRGGEWRERPGGGNLPG